MMVVTRPIGAADLVLLEALGSGLPLAGAQPGADGRYRIRLLQGALALHI